MQSKSVSRKKEIDPGETDLALKAGAGFPTARYFQIHFEFLQEQLHQTMEALQSLQMQMRQMEARFPVRQNLPGHSTLDGMPVTTSTQVSPKAVSTQPKRRSSGHA